MHLRRFLPAATVALAAILCSCRRDEAPGAADFARARAATARTVGKNRDWYEKHFIKAYLESPYHEPQWDGPVTNILALMASFRTGQTPFTEAKAAILPVTTQALREGCHDPYVRYLNTRFGGADEEENGARARLYADAAAQLLSGYPPDMAFYACVRGARGLQGKKAEVTPEIYQLREGAVTSLLGVLADQRVPAVEMRAECAELTGLLRRNPTQLASAWSRMEPLLAKNWDGTAEGQLIEAEYHYNRGWSERGNGYAGSVGSKEAKLFEGEMLAAEKHFRLAWRRDNTDPETAKWMMELCVCLGHPRAEMEKWFGYAVAANPRYHPAFRTKLRFLEPKWYGSPEEMIAFGHECLTNAAYGAEGPLTLVEAYNTLVVDLRGGPEKLAQFMAEPQLWEDIQAACAEGARRNPDAAWPQNTLVWYAWKCGHWQVLEREIPRLAHPDYNYFGGEEGYRKMLEASQAHGAGKP